MIYKLYLDNCCFNRPYNNQSNLITYLETQAKLFVQKEILNGRFELVWSFILDYENSQNPYEERKKSILDWRDITITKVGISEKVTLLSKRIIEIGIKEKDALHIGCSIIAKCDYFLTTDKKY